MKDNRTADAQSSSVDRGQAYLEIDLMVKGKRVDRQTGADQEGYKNLMTCM